jgi:hypothetical protein
MSCLSFPFVVLVVTHTYPHILYHLIKHNIALQSGHHHHLGHVRYIDGLGMATVIILPTRDHSSIYVYRHLCTLWILIRPRSPTPEVMDVHR